MAWDGIDVKVKEEGGELFEEQTVDAGDEFLAVKPWMGVIKNSVPRSYKASALDLKEPEASLELEYVYGYWCHDVRNNLWYIQNENFVFNTAGIGVVMDPKKNS